MILIIVGVLVFISVMIGLLNGQTKKENKQTDSDKFAKEYKLVDKEDNNIDNVFVYRSMDEIIKILKNGTGIVYLGFPECPWCSEYVKYLNEVAKDKKLEKIYYKNILNERKDNTEKYQEIVKLLKDNLQFDEEGNKRIYVPAVIAVKDGKIVGFDDETAWDTKGYDSPAEYWKNEDLKGLKKKLSKMIDNTNKNICTSNCNK